MISPHLPPEQAANALLPVVLADALAAHDVATTFVAHPPAEPPRPSSRHVVYVPRRGRAGFSRTAGGAVFAGGGMAMGARRAVAQSDLVHLHGNGFIVEVGGLLARWHRKPYVITLYGTDIWHHDPARHVRFARVVREAAERVFYSQGLVDFARTFDLAPDPSKVIYAPVAPTFHALDPDTRTALRRELGVADAPLLLTVKRLHAVAGHEDLLRAMPAILRECSGARLWLAGEGELRGMLEALARELGIGPQVRFLGRLDNATLWRYYAAADLFVLPSRLESWGTVMLEALACGTPVIATDTSGGREVQGNFPNAVTIVPRESPGALAEAVSLALKAPARVERAANERQLAGFSAAHCADEYLAVYQRALQPRSPA